ncbi:MAG: hypothetical protein QM346_13490 [Chloroflexota bacterium]|nr:hypothetical protein [Chloroflexota bacterium]
MRILRSLALAAVVGAAYFAQAMLDKGGLAGVIPDSLLLGSPFLLRMSRWLPQDLMAFALWLAVVAALGFGLISPLWREERRPARRNRAAGVAASATAAWMPPVLAVAAWAMIGAATAGIHWLPMPPAASHLLWLGGIAFYLVAGFVGSRRRDAASSRPANGQRPAPLAGWPWALILLVVVAVLITLRWADLPARVDVVTARAGLQASTLLRDGANWFVPDLLPIPALASAVAAAGQSLTGDALLGVRLAGLVAGLILIASVWLLGCELFRRRPLAGAFGEVIEDDGAFPALLAAVIAAGGTTFLFFARVPIFIEGVAWGTLGVWALLFALRRESTGLLGVSGLLFGLGTVYGPNGLSLIGAAILIWAGVLALWPDWMRSTRWASNRRLAVGVAYWAGGVLLTVVPVFVGVGGSSGGLSAYLSMNLFAESHDPAWQMAANGLSAFGGFWRSLQAALLAPNVGLDASAITGLSGSMLSSIVAPFFLLAIGALLMSVDTLLGWTLLNWLAAGAAFSVLWAHPVAPHWPSLLAIWPAVALATAFGLDRLRVTAMLSFGTWLMQASVYLIVGMAAGAAMLSWISFFEQGQVNAGSASAFAREIRQAAQEGQSVAVVSSMPGLLMDNAAAAFLAGRDGGAVRADEYAPDALPDSLPGGVRVLLPVGDPYALEQARARYPSARLIIRRDLAGNPQVYVLEISP